MNSTRQLFQSIIDSLPPAPRFDCVAVHDLRVFHSIPWTTTAQPYTPGYVSPALVGVPVIEDESVEVGVIELRKGSEVIKRVLLSELRA